MSSMDRIKVRGFIYAGVSAFLFGLVPFFSKTLLLAGYSSDMILTYRYIIATLIYLLYILVRRVDIRIPWKTAVEILLIGLLCLAPTSYLYLLSFNYIPTGVATSISYLYPVVVAVLMWMFYAQQLYLSIKVGIFAAVLGVALISWEPGTIRLLGIVYALLTTITYGVYFVVLNRPRMKQVAPIVLTFYFMLFGAVGFTLFATVNQEMRFVLALDFLYNTFMLALFCSILASYLLIRSIAYVGSVSTAVWGTFEPLTALLVGVSYFGEKVTLSGYAGFMLIILAVWLTIKERNGKGENGCLKHERGELGR